MGRMTAALVAGLLVTGAGCSSGKGLGKAACPYVRPRLVRLDTARLHLGSDPAGAAANIGAVAADVADYVGQLPDSGRDRKDQTLVRFSTSLSAYSRSVSGPALGSAAGSAVDSAVVSALDSAEVAMKRECGVAI